MATETATHGAEAVAHGAEKASTGLPQLNPESFEPQLVWLAISFIALYFLLSRIALPRVGEVIRERKLRIQRDISEADRLKDETEKAIASYEQSVAEARGRANAITQENRDKMHAEIERERTKLDEQIAAETASAEMQIREAKQAALAKVSEIADDTAAALLSKLIGIDVSADERRKAVAEAQSVSEARTN